MSAAHVLNQRIRPLTRKSNAPPGGPHFGSNSPLYGAQRESNARGLPGGGGMGGFGIDWYISNGSRFTKTNCFWLSLAPLPTAGVIFLSYLLRKKRLYLSSSY